MEAARGGNGGGLDMIQDYDEPYGRIITMLNGGTVLVNSLRRIEVGRRNACESNKVPTNNVHSS